MDNSSEAALITLTAFIGAVFGFTGCLAAVLTNDAGLGGAAAAGGAICTLIWHHYLLADERWISSYESRFELRPVKTQSELDRCECQRNVEGLREIGDEIAMPFDPNR